jgi:hypothetical protein
MSTLLFISFHFVLALGHAPAMVKSSKHGRRKILALNLLPLTPKLGAKRGGFCSRPCFQVPNYGAQSLKIKLKAKELPSTMPIAKLGSSKHGQRRFFFFLASYFQC